MTIYDLLAGPTGGLMALAYGLGCASGFGFCLWMMQSRIKELSTEVHNLKLEIEQWKGREAAAQERLLAHLTR